MFSHPLSPRALAIMQALLVTFLWSTSWVFIKFGLREQIPALTFAGLRYTLAFLCLLPIVLRKYTNLVPLLRLRRRDLVRVIAFGLVFIAITQGAQFVSLAYLPAATVNLLLGFSSVAVALLALALLSEKPTNMQWAGLGLYLAGAIIFFVPISLSQGETVGVVAALIGVLANSVSSVMGRSLNREHVLPPVTMAAVTMGIGGILLLVVGTATQGFPPLSLTTIAVIVWLAVVNTAFAFTLWNLTLKTLPALESSIINNTMMVQIPILAWIFLGEALTWKTALGLLIAVVGIVIVQLRRVPVRRVRTNVQPELRR